MSLAQKPEAQAGEIIAHLLIAARGYCWDMPNANKCEGIGLTFRKLSDSFQPPDINGAYVFKP